MFDWATIEERIYINVSKILKNGSPSFSEEQIKEAISLFKSFVIYKSGYHALDGLPRYLLPSLQEAFIDKKGEPASLTNISTNIEPFIRKILVLIFGESYANIENMTLAPLLKKININAALSGQRNKFDYPQLDIANIDSYMAASEYLYSICSAYITRNTVHDASDLDDAEVLNALKHILIVYIYIVLKHINDIKRLPNILVSANVENQIIDENQKMLYNFINFGNTSIEIKTQIVNAFILNYLRNKESVQIEKIIDESNNYFENSFSSGFYKRKIDNLIQKQKVEYVDKESIKLTNTESDNLSKAQINFQENRDLFFMFFDELLKKYNIEIKRNELLRNIELFLENNFNIDLCEIYCNEIKSDSTVYAPLLEYLKSLTCTDELAESLFKDILVLCEDNDFLVRMSASKVFSKISNPDQFQNYLRQQKRIVYLDTQIILYALCYNYLPNDEYDNIFHRTTSALLSYVEKNPSIELKFGNQYLSEIAYQLKLALFLIPFADNDITEGVMLSTNIFYRFYFHLKKNDLLDEETKTFADFMSNWLSLEEEDAYDSDYDRIASNSMIDILKDELNIEIVKLPYYEDCDSASNLLEEVIKENLLSIKTHYVLKNDAIMVCHLSNSQYHINEPFFLTWDKSFTPFRKKFKDKFKKRDLISWHLFTPSKFLNHMDLINFKINPSSMTNDFLSVMDGLGLHNMTRTIVDSMNRFLDIKNISRNQRHVYIKITKEIFSESEFSYEISTPIDELKTKISDSFAEVLDQINNFLYTDSKSGIDKYRKMLLNESYFRKIAELIQLQVKTKLIGSSVNNKSLFEEIEKYIKEYEEISAISIVDKNK